MASDHLRDQHPFRLVLWFEPDQGCQHSLNLLVPHLRGAMGKPQGIAYLIYEDLVEGIVIRSACRLELAWWGVRIWELCFHVLWFRNLAHLGCFSRRGPMFIASRAATASALRFACHAGQHFEWSHA